SQNQHRDFFAGFDQGLCGHQSITAVVAFATHHANCFKPEMHEAELGSCKSGALHEQQSGSVFRFHGMAFRLAHFISGEDSHELTGAACAASASSFASCEGSPMAMRKSPARIGSWARGLNRMSPSPPRMARIMMPN